nr:putative transcription factor sol4 [Quercus suber]
MKQLIYTPVFLLRYHQWWSRPDLPTVVDVEFAVLLLRICSYTVQLLPFPTCNTAGIDELSLSDIRLTCSALGDDLAEACVALDWRGSLVRVQHNLFRAMDYSCRGRTDKFWEGIGSAARAAQKIGIHKTAPMINDSTVNMDRELGRRVFCCLYVLDSHMARQLDRLPFLPDDFAEELLPQMHLVPVIASSDVSGSAPEIFAERLLQLKLNRFWRHLAADRNSAYDPVCGENRHERFRKEYLSSLPPAFAMDADTKWDSRLPHLTMQRQVLHICILDSICSNFRPLLLLKPSQIAILPPYKQVLLRSQKKVLAITALQELETISCLHTSLNATHTRLSIVIFNTFEAAVLLLCLCSQSHADIFADDRQCGIHIGGSGHNEIRRGEMLLAAEKALDRLRMLAQASNMASSGARVLEQLTANVKIQWSVSWTARPPPSRTPSVVGQISGSYKDYHDVAYQSMGEPSGPNVMTDFLSTMLDECWSTNLEWLESDLEIPHSVGGGE